MKKRNIVKLFESRKVDLDDRIKQDYAKNGIVTLPCGISGYDDIISQYSVNGYETLNMEFADYVKTAVGFAPPEYPIVLDVIGGCLSEKEKKTINDTICDTFAYELGAVEKEEKRHTKVFVFMIVGLILSGILLYFTHSIADEPRELFYILFWFAGDTLCDYIFLTGHDLRHDRRMAGRLASIKVVFSDKHEEPNYTKNDADRLYSEIEKDVRDTIGDK